MKTFIVIVIFLVGSFVITFFTIRKIKKNAKKNKDKLLDKTLNRLDKGLEELGRNIQESCSE